MTVCLVKNEKYIRTRVYKERIDKQKLFSMVTARLLLLFKANNIVMANNIDLSLPLTSTLLNRARKLECHTATTARTRSRRKFLFRLPQFSSFVPHHLFCGSYPCGNLQKLFIW